MGKLTIRYIGKPILEQVIKGRRSLRSVVEKETKPNKRLMALIGEEMVRGFQGGARLVGVKIGPKGGISFSRGGLYPYGIWRQKSPDGTPYAKSPKSTINLKKRTDRPDGLPKSTTPELALIDQKDLVNGLTYRVNVRGDGVHTYFVNEEIADKSLRLERGVSFVSTSFTKNKGATRMILDQPKRPHRGIQKAVNDTITRILKAWVEKSKKI